MNSLIQLKKRLQYFVVALTAFALSPTAQAQLDPPPDGFYGPPNYGVGNTAEGKDALFSLSTGTENTAIGFEALHNNETGHFNTATGSGALHDNTADSNTANGRSALHNNTEGNYNTAVGRVRSTITYLAS